MTLQSKLTVTRRAVLAGSGAAAALAVAPALASAKLMESKATQKAYDNSPLQRHLCKSGHPKMAMDLQMDVIAARVKGDRAAEVAAIRGSNCPHCDTHIATSLDYMAMPYNLV